MNLSRARVVAQGAAGTAATPLKEAGDATAAPLAAGPIAPPDAPVQTNRK